MLICCMILHKHVIFICYSNSSIITILISTCSGSVSCSRLLCLRVVWRIFTSSIGLQDDSRGINSDSFSTKLSCRLGSSDTNSLKVAHNMEQWHRMLESIWICKIQFSHNNPQCKYPILHILKYVSEIQPCFLHDSFLFHRHAGCGALSPTLI